LCYIRRPAHYQKQSSICTGIVKCSILTNALQNRYSCLHRLSVNRQKQVHYTKPLIVLEISIISSLQIAAEGLAPLICLNLFSNFCGLLLYPLPPLSFPSTGVPSFSTIPPPNLFLSHSLKGLLSY
jgi:hypothetical protein